MTGKVWHSRAEEQRVLSKAAFLTMTLTLMAYAALAQSSLPDPMITPGATNPDVTQANIGETICQRGWTHSIRPLREYTDEMKREQIRRYGYADRSPSHYEEDHLIPLDLGGAPRDPQNLWPEPRHPRDGWTAERKDELEAVLVRLVCAGRVPLDEAQRIIARDWRAAYHKYVGAAE